MRFPMRTWPDGTGAGAPPRLGSVSRERAVSAQFREQRRIRVETTCSPLGRVRKGAVLAPPGARVAVIFLSWNSLPDEREVSAGPEGGIGDDRGILVLDVGLDALRVLLRVALDVADSVRRDLTACQQCTRALRSC